MARLTFTEAAGSAWPLKGPVTMDLSELKRAELQPRSPTYTFDTLSELRREHPHLAFVIGTDQLEKLHTWQRFPEVLGLSHWIVLERKNEAAQASAGVGRKVLNQLEASGLLTPQAGGYRIRNGGTFIQVFTTPAPAMSATRIRESLARSGNPPEGSMLPEARAYLMKHRLYGTGQLHNPGE
jgi:nicotinate-nucleotide adenylyltransferase